MYAIALIRYRRPLDEVLKALDAHRAYLRSLQEQGLLIASGITIPTLKMVRCSTRSGPGSRYWGRKTGIRLVGANGRTGRLPAD